MKLIIAGNRDLSPTSDVIHEELHKWGHWLSFLHSRNGEEIQVVSGAAKGVDRSGEVYALTRGPTWSVRRFAADWDKYGKGAGHIRNEQMGRYADAAILFFKGGPSPGTSNMLAWMAILKKPYHVVVL